MSRFGTLGTQFFDDAGDPLNGGSIDFYSPGTTTRKNTYIDSGLATANSNPVVLTAAGRLPADVWFDGVIDAVIRDSDGTIIETKYNLGSGNAIGFEVWSSITLYAANDVVRGSDGNLYRSITADNQGNNPTSDTTNWTRIDYVETWNSNVTYSVGDIVIGSNRVLYTCSATSTNNNPVTDDSSYWAEASPYKTGDIVISADSARYVSPEWLECLGQSYSSTTYSALYAKLGSFPVILSTPGSAPSGSHLSASWSSDDTYLAMGVSISPYIAIYKRSGDTFTKLSNPATLPPSAHANSADGVSFDSSDTYLATTSSTTPFVTIYKRSGDTFTKLSNPATLPPAAGTCCAFSPDTNYLVVGSTTTSPFLTIYERSGDTFTKLSDPATVPSAYVQSVAWDSTSTYLVLGVNASPYVMIYKRSGSTFTKLSDPATLPSGLVKSVAFNADGSKLYLGLQTSAYLMSYDRSGDTFTAATDADEITAPGSAASISINADGDRLAFGHSATGYLSIYKINGNTLIDVDSPDDVPASQTYGVAYSNTGAYLAQGVSGSPYVAVYKESPVLPKTGRTLGTLGNLSAYIKTGI